MPYQDGTPCSFSGTCRRGMCDETGFSRFAGFFVAHAAASWGLLLTIITLIVLLVRRCYKHSRNPQEPNSDYHYRHPASIFLFRQRDDKRNVAVLAMAHAPESAKTSRIHRRNGSSGRIGSGGLNGYDGGSDGIRGDNNDNRKHDNDNRIFDEQVEIQPVDVSPPPPPPLARAAQPQSPSIASTKPGRSAHQPVFSVTALAASPYLIDDDDSYSSANVASPMRDMVRVRPSTADTAAQRRDRADTGTPRSERLPALTARKEQDITTKFSSANGDQR